MSKYRKKEETRQPDRMYNCSGVMGPCPLQGNCLVNSVIYKAEVSDSNQNLQTYTGLTGVFFKIGIIVTDRASTTESWRTQQHFQRTYGNSKTGMSHMR